MNTSQRHSKLLLPLTIAISLVVGILLGNHFSNQKYSADNDRKLNNILNLIATNYVDDTVNLDELIELSIPQLLSNLDPHSAYISAKDLQATEDELNGSFSGIGISFQLINDTITVVEVIPNGPAFKVGLLANDRIVTVNDTTFVGPTVDSNKVRAKIRGPKGTKVKLGIKRQDSDKLISFEVKRDDVPINSVDAAYMLDREIGYVKVNQFGANTYDEFLTALSKLREQGAKKYVVDLRGNGGGYMEIAIQMVNEFLAANQLIVSTKGRNKRDDSEIYSDNNGQFQNEEVVTLIDEFSASASEIFAGALQDNDRGLVVGVRSFGKGLVQRQFDLPDHSAVRLTIARYYTPSGRCIQKSYENGFFDYSQEIFDRFKGGELDSKDSVKFDSKEIFSTAHGRTVYGGGGIMPDIFVPIDTTGFTPYFYAVRNAGLLQQFSFKYVEQNKAELKKLGDYNQFLRVMPSNESLVANFAQFAEEKGVPARWFYISQSRDLIASQLKALIARDLFGMEAYYAISNRNDKTIDAAVKALNKHKAVFPIMEQ